MHLPVAVHRHPRPGHHPDRPEPGRGHLSNGSPGRDPSNASSGRDPSNASPGAEILRSPASAARNVTRGTVLATDVEIGGSLWAKFMGLMGRESLAAGTGLWLPESNGIHMMFMRFPIDAVFLGGEVRGGGRGDGSDASGSGRGEPRSDDPARPVRRVVAVYRGLRAWTGLVPFVRGAHGVLELPVGAIDASQTQAGDLIEIG